MNRGWFKIQLDTPDHTFSSGETITGRVIVDLTKPKNLRGLRITIKGEAYVSWEESTGTGDDKSTRHYTAKEPYFKMKTYLLGQPDGETMELPLGSHTFPFLFCLPHNIPSSFECRDGHIRYTIKAVIDRPWKYNHETTIPFNFETPYVLTQPPTPMHAVEGETFKTFCCCLCVNMGALEFDVHLPSRSFAIGEIIEAKIVVINNTSRSVDVTKFELQIEQVTQLHANKSIEKKYSIVQRVEDARRFNKRDETILRMQVPSVPHSKLVHCSIIDNDYYLNVVISFSGCRWPAKKQYPIEIGVRPALNGTAENSETIRTLKPAVHPNKGWSNTLKNHRPDPRSRKSESRRNACTLPYISIVYEELTLCPVVSSEPMGRTSMTYQLARGQHFPEKSGN